MRLPWNVEYSANVEYTQDDGAQFIARNLSHWVDELRVQKKRWLYNASVGVLTETIMRIDDYATRKIEGNRLKYLSCPVVVRMLIALYVRLTFM